MQKVRLLRCSGDTKRVADLAENFVTVRHSEAGVLHATLLAHSAVQPVILPSTGTKRETLGKNTRTEFLVPCTSRSGFESMDAHSMSDYTLYAGIGSIVNEKVTTEKSPSRDQLKMSRRASSFSTLRWPCGSLQRITLWSSIEIASGETRGPIFVNATDEP